MTTITTKFSKSFIHFSITGKIRKNGCVKKLCRALEPVLNILRPKAESKDKIH